MGEYKATIHWQKKPEDDFRNGRFSREHTWSFDGGITLPASPSPHVVRAPFSNPAAVDPEEAFVASIACCHMLTFLYLASKRGFELERYEDEATGFMTKNERGKQWVSSVELAPRTTWVGERAPTPAELAELHHASHEECFIANSVKTEIRVKTV